MNLPTSILTKNQKKVFGPKIYTENGTTYKLTATVRYDDECGNGHNSFAITGAQYRKNTKGQWEEDAFGCLHEDISKHFPELAPLIKWHSASSDGPWGYLANTIYFAGDKDCWGLRKDERRQIKNGKTGKPAWEQMARHKTTGEVLPLYKLETYRDSEAIPDCEYELIWHSWDKVGEGKARELDKARNAAIWPDATDEDLTAPGLEERLKARLPQLMQEFKTAVESLGFVY